MWLHHCLYEKPQDTHEYPVRPCIIYAEDAYIDLCSSSDDRPFACPDMVTVVGPPALSGSSQPPVSEIPCTYRSNCDSGLIKHRVKFHGYVPDPKRSMARRRANTSSRVESQATASRSGLLPVPPRGITQNSNQTSQSLHAHPSVASVPSQAANCCYTRDTQYGELWNGTPHAFAARPDTIGAMSNGSAHIFPQSPLSLSENPSIPEDDSSDFGSSTSCTTADGSLVHSDVSVPDSLSPSQQPSNNSVCHYLCTLDSDTSNDSGHMGSFAHSLIVPQNSHISVSLTLSTHSPPPILEPVLPGNHLNPDNSSPLILSEFAPCLSDLQSELHEDDIFFRGTGREGCLCPEMMIDAGIEGWDKSLLDW